MLHILFNIAPMSRATNQKDEQASRLRAARAAAGFLTPSEAVDKFRWKGSTYMAHENGQNGIRPEPAVVYAKAFGVDPGWILTGIGRGPDKAVNARESITTSGSMYNPDHWPRDLRVLGLAECGPDGWSLWNGEIIEMTSRPPNLAGASQAYAVYVAGDSMEPRYHAGELAYIHPGRPVDVGSYVLVQVRPEVEGDTPRAILKRLAKRSTAKILLEQFNPPKTIELRTSEVISVHRVVGSGEA